MQLSLPLSATVVTERAVEHKYGVRFTSKQGKIVREISAGSLYRSTVNVSVRSPETLSDFDWHWLRAREWPEVQQVRGSLSVADLFCGSGGLSLGAWEAARAVQLRLKPILAVDNDADAVAAYTDNFAPAHGLCSPLEKMVDGKLGAKATATERLLLRKLGTIDLLLAGPPCQGHSDLNNHTRRDDPRNELLLRVVRFAELFSPRSFSSKTFKACVTIDLAYLKRQSQHSRAWVFSRSLF